MIGKSDMEVGQVTNRLDRQRMLSERLRVDLSFIPAFCGTTLYGEKVFVAFVVNGEPVLIDDDSGMFPSDKLVAQVNLLLDTIPPMSEQEHIDMGISAIMPQRQRKRHVSGSIEPYAANDIVSSSYKGEW